jgi:hypothetical protein
MTVNHHFLAPIDATGFQFTPGRYRIEVFAHLLGKRIPRRLLVQDLELTSEIAAQMLVKPGTGVFFNWGPDSGRYHAHTEDRPSLPDLLGALGLKSFLPPPVKRLRLSLPVIVERNRICSRLAQRQ